MRFVHGTFLRQSPVPAALAAFVYVSSSRTAAEFCSAHQCGLEDDHQLTIIVSHSSTGLQSYSMLNVIFRLSYIVSALLDAFHLVALMWVPST
jgi:hypothetical protein